MVHVQNMVGRTGKNVANQFILTENPDSMSGNAVEYFQSYQSIIVKRDKFRAGIETRKVWLDINKWDYSTTTGKYRNQFLGETRKETEAKIKSGEYELVDLN